MATPGLHPPKARLALRVGVTGHRPNRLPQAQQAVLRGRVRDVLEGIRQIVLAWQRANPSLFSKEPPLLRLVSSLAEGADRVAAEEAVSAGWELQSPLPFPKEEYEKDFASSESKDAFAELIGRATAVMELDGSRDGEPAAYLAAGRMTLNHCDVLLAVWDGQQAHGEGGTGQIVEEALHRKIPVVWIAAAAPHSVQLLNRPGDTRTPRPEGDCTEFCGTGFQPVKNHGQDGRATSLGTQFRTVPPEASLEDELERLGHRIDQLLRPPEHPPETGQPTRETESDRCRAYFTRRQRAGTLGFVWLWFRDFFADFKLRPPQVKVPDFQASTTAEWERELEKVPPALHVPQATAERWEKQWREAPALPQQVEDYLKDSLRGHYSWADNLAGYYSNLYRSSFVLGYLLSAVAVLAAMMGAGLRFLGNRSVYESLLIAFELAVMIVLLLTWRWSRSFHWHDCWIDYRLLAEQLRIQRFLAPLGFALPSTHPPGPHRSHGDPKGTWMYWHFRSIVREAGLPPARLDASYLHACRVFLWKKLAMDQWVYHRQSIHVRMDRLRRHLHIIETVLIWTVILTSACHLLVPDLGHFPFAMIVAAVCPAFSAALYAIGVQAELDRLVKRSGAMSEQFEKVAYKLSEPDAAGSSQTLLQIIEPLAENMIAEHFDWRLVFQEREWTPV